MKTLYFFTTSLNFGNIFSSESISPESFYAKRGFGFDYFENPLPQIKDYIILFEQFPNIDLQKSNEIDIYKIIFELDITNVQVQKTEIEGVWCCPDTIYLSLQNLKKVYFQSKEQQIKVIVKAESSKALKVLTKYEHIFDFAKTHQITTYNLLDIKFENNEKISIHIEKDRIFNNFKGLIYGLICSKSNNKSPNEVAYIKSLQDIKNCFALLKNSLAHSSFNNYSKDQSYKKYSSTKNYDYNSTSEVLRNLKNTIDESERLFINFIDIIGKIDYVVEYLKIVIFKNYKWVVNSDHIEGALHLAKSMKIVEKNLEQDAINWFLENNPENPYILYEIVRISIQGYHGTTSKERQEDYDSDILKALFRLEKYAEKIILEKIKDIPITDFKSIGLQDLDITLPEYLHKDKFDQLINMVLKNAKIGKGKISDQQLVPIVENAGEIFKKDMGKKTNLYRYLTKQDSVYKDANTNSIIFKNFTAFIFNPNDVEKLQKYLEEKGIAESQYAFAFFGAFNGFASMSKDFTRSIFEKTELQKDLDVYLEDIRTKLNKIEISFRSDFSTKPEPESELSYQDIMENSKRFTFPTQKVSSEYISRDLHKIDLQEFKEEILLTSNKEKIVKLALQDKFQVALDSCLRELDKQLSRFPINAQKDFTKRQLLVLLTGKFKVDKIGETTIKKLLKALK